jgi:hypothetical protein
MTDALYVPVAHAHAVPCGVASCRLGHAVQNSPRMLNSVLATSEHAWHARAPISRSGWLPAGQGRHVLPTLSALCMPCGHSSHERCPPISAKYLPARQLLQTLSFGTSPGEHTIRSCSCSVAVDMVAARRSALLGSWTWFCKLRMAALACGVSNRNDSLTCTVVEVSDCARRRRPTASSDVTIISSACTPSDCANSAVTCATNSARAADPSCNTCVDAVVLRVSATSGCSGSTTAGATEAAVVTPATVLLCVASFASPMAGLLTISATHDELPRFSSS